MLVNVEIRERDILRAPLSFIGDLPQGGRELYYGILYHTTIY